MEAVIYKFDILNSESQHIYIRGKQIFFDVNGVSL